VIGPEKQEGKANEIICNVIATRLVQNRTRMNTCLQFRLASFSPPFQSNPHPLPAEECWPLSASVDFYQVSF
jgi:hypothetical protein